MTLLRLLPIFVLPVASALGVSPALAQPSQPEAQRTFEEGKQLLAEKRYDEAIATFRRVQSAYPSVGALFNIGDAYERTDRPVAAWAAYAEAERLAHAKLDPRAKIATERARALEPRLPKLLVRDASDDLLVTVNGSVPREEWNGPLKRPPGSYELVARARCKVTATMRIDITDAHRQDVVVEPLQPDPACTKAPETKPNVQRLAGYGVGGAGAVALGVGTVFGLMAMSTKSDLDRACGDYANCVTPDRRHTDDLNATANSQSSISTIGFIAGGVLLATGVVLVLTAPRDGAPRTLAARF